jgi:hypothetical protein
MRRVIQLAPLLDTPGDARTVLNYEPKAAACATRRIILNNYYNRCFCGALH